MPEINQRFITLRGKIEFPREVKTDERIQLILDGVILNFDQFETKQKNNNDGTVDETYAMKFHSIEPLR